MTKKALKMALEALENHSGNYKLSKAECAKHEIVIATIKEVLAQPEQEQKPAAKIYAELSKSSGLVGRVWWLDQGLSVGNYDLYTTPPQRKPLPYEQLDLLWQTTDTGDFDLDIREFARAIEAAHNIF